MLPPAQQSAVLAQVHAWLDTGSTPNVIAVKETHASVGKRVRALLNAGEPTQLAKLKKLRQQALHRTDLPRSTAFLNFIFGSGGGGSTSTGGASRPVVRRARGPRSKHLPREEPPEVTSVSRVSGRAVKTPSKFKEPVSSPRRRGQLRLSTYGQQRAATTPHQPQRSVRTRNCLAHVVIRSPSTLAPMLAPSRCWSVDSP